MQVKDKDGNLRQLKPGERFGTEKRGTVYELQPSGAHKRVSKRLTGRERRLIRRVINASL